MSETVVIVAAPANESMYGALAARNGAVVTVEKIVSTDFIRRHADLVRLPAQYVRAVVETPHGAHFTECVPDYPRDEAFQRAYVAGAKTDEAWDAFRAQYVDVPGGAGHGIVNTIAPAGERPASEAPAFTSGLFPTRLG